MIHVNYVSDIECIQLTEPGRVTVICQIRSVLDMDMFPLCLFVESSVNIPCKLYACMLRYINRRLIFINFVGNDIHNIVLVPSEIPFISDFILPQNVSFTISAFDPEESCIQITLNVSLSKL